MIVLVFQLWGLDLSDSNQQSDWEAGCCKRELPSNNNEDTSEIDIQDPYTLPICGHTTSQYTSSNIGYYVFEYREEEEDTGMIFFHTKNVSRCILLVLLGDRFKTYTNTLILKSKVCLINTEQ